MYFFYIDDSGQIDYGKKASKYFVYNALGIESSDWHNINQQVVELKLNTFKTPNAELLEVKSNWLRIPKEREERWYLKKLNSGELKNFSQGLFDIILQNNITLIACVIDKNKMLEKYQQNAYEPNVYAIELLLERISLFMNNNHPDKQAVIVADKCSNEIEAMLNKNHVIRRNHGGYTWKNLSSIIENLIFVDSKYSNFIQLTDLCAYNIFHAFEYNKPGYEFFRKILPKYYCINNGLYKGCILSYGIVYKPMKKNETVKSETLNLLREYRIPL